MSGPARAGGVQDERGVRASDSERDRGAAIVELALVSSLLFLLLFGIISYAFMMSFRQSMTQAAAEGARAAALAPPGQATTRGDAALAEALGGFDESCGSSGLTCTVAEAPCDGDPTRSCVTVELDYDYGGHPLLPELPLLAGVLPDSLGARSVAEVNR